MKNKAAAPKDPAIRFDDDRHDVYLYGVVVYLLPKEWKILRLLYESKKVQTRRQIIDAIWPEQIDVDIDSRKIDQYVARLRGKIGASLIETVQQVGYRIAAGV